MKYVISSALAVALLVSAIAAQGDQESGFRLARGKIETPGESSMKVKDTPTESNTYQAGETTKVKVKGKNKLGDLQAGDEITIVYQRQGQKNVIREVNNLSYTRGKVQSLEEGTITIKDSGNKQWTLKTNDTTQFSLNEKTSKIGQMKTGDECQVAYTPNDGEPRQGTARFVVTTRSSN